MTSEEWMDQQTLDINGLGSLTDHRNIHRTRAHRPLPFPPRH